MKFRCAKSESRFHQRSILLTARTHSRDFKNTIPGTAAALAWKLLKRDWEANGSNRRVLSRLSSLGILLHVSCKERGIHLRSRDRIAVIARISAHSRALRAARLPEDRLPISDIGMRSGLIDKFKAKRLREEARYKPAAKASPSRIDLWWLFWIPKILGRKTLGSDTFCLPQLRLP